MFILSIYLSLISYCVFVSQQSHFIIRHNNQIDYINLRSAKYALVLQMLEYVDNEGKRGGTRGLEPVEPMLNILTILLGIKFLIKFQSMNGDYII